MLLDQLLDALDVETEAFALCQIDMGWQLAVPRSGRIAIHYVLRGAGELLFLGQRTPFSAMNAVVVPSGLDVRIEPGANAVRGSALFPTSPARADNTSHALQHVSTGGELDNAALVIASGHVRATYREGIGLFDHLREPLVLAAENAPVIDSAFAGLIRESNAPGPGSRAMMSAYMNQGLIAVLRELCTQGECRVPWLAALDDPRLARALRQLLDHLADNHTLESLAKVAGMSRSSFSERFSAAFNTSPMDLLREARVRHAWHLLATSDRSVQAVASQVGFSSRSAFSRAFKAVTGADPSAVRTLGHGHDG